MSLCQSISGASPRHNHFSCEEMRPDPAWWTEKGRSQIGEDRLRAFIRRGSAQADADTKRQKKNMKQPENIQAGPIVPALLNIKPEVFMAELTRAIGDNIVFPAEQHARFVEALHAHLKDERGQKPSLNSAQTDRLRAVYRPTESNLRNIRAQTFAEAGYALDPETEKVFDMVLNAAQFADFLAKNNNPKTKKPFIAKPKKRGVKKGTFTDMVLAAVEPSETVTAGDESPVVDESDEQQVETGTDEGEHGAEIPEPAPAPVSKPTPKPSTKPGGQK